MDERERVLSKQQADALKKLVELENEYDKRVKELGFSGEPGDKAVVLSEANSVELADLAARVEEALQHDEACRQKLAQYRQSHRQ